MITFLDNCNQETTLRPCFEWVSAMFVGV